MVERGRDMNINTSDEEGQYAEFSRYMVQARRQPVLTAQEELIYARAAASGDANAVDALVRAHMRLVARIARTMRYGVSIMDLISEGTLGLLHGISRFDADKGFRLSTYVQWWIKASMQEYILRNWSLMRMGSTASQKRLFFNLGRTKSQLGIYDGDTLGPRSVTQVAQLLSVSTRDVEEMDIRMSRTAICSLNAPIGTGSDGGDDMDVWQERLVDQSPTPEEAMLDINEKRRRQALLSEALHRLKPRERAIIERRSLEEKPATFAQLAQEYGVTGERIRQIETIALRKIKKTVRAFSNDADILPNAA